MDTITSDFVYAGDLDELKVKGRLVVRGRPRPLLLIYNGSQGLAQAGARQLAAGLTPADLIRQVALFGARNRDWDSGLTILTALFQLLPFLSEEDVHLALFQGVRRVAADCDGE